MQFGISADDRPQHGRISTVGHRVGHIPVQQLLPRCCQVGTGRTNPCRCRRRRIVGEEQVRDLAVAEGGHAGFQALDGPAAGKSAPPVIEARPHVEVGPERQGPVSGLGHGLAVGGDFLFHDGGGLPQWRGQVIDHERPGPDVSGHDHVLGTDLGGRRGHFRRQRLGILVPCLLDVPLKTVL